MKRTILSAALASVLVLAGCGSNEDEEAKSAITSYLSTQQAGQQVASMKKKDASCIADRMVDEIGVDQLKEYDVLNDDGSFNKKLKGFEMSGGDAEVMADAFLDCSDLMKQLEAQAGSLPASKTPEGKKCLDETLTEDAVRDMLTASISGDQEKASAFQADLMKCASIGTGKPSEEPSS